MRAYEFIYSMTTESAGVGIITKQNSTVDVEPDTIKKNGQAFGFDLDLNGIPPKISKDSINKD